MHKRLAFKTAAVLVLAAALVTISCNGKTKNVQLSHTLFNFDAHVWVKGPVDDFHLDLCCVDSSEITRNFFIPVSDSMQYENRFRVQPICCGTRATWEFSPPMYYCQWVHFGIGFNHNPCVRPIGATWTYKTKPVGQAPFPMQIWLTEKDTVIDVIMNPKYCYPDCERPKDIQIMTDTIIIERSWAFSETVFELNELTWNNDSLMKKLKWQDDKAFTMKAGDKAELRIPNAGEHKAILVKYTVKDPKGEALYHFINEAVIEREK